MIAALAGGVGGAKLAHGLMQILGGDLAVVVNTGDDFQHLGQHISPDLDTVMYTLAGIANPDTGWGVADETWNFLDQLQRLGGPGWFRLGDRDLATHVVRSERLRRGERLTAVTLDLCRRLGIAARILPMCDEPVRTIVRTDEGPLAFQEYFVARRCEVVVRGFSFEGAEQAHPTAEVRAALTSTDAVILCPSNPFVSIDPILAVPGLRTLLADGRAPIVAVSPIIGGSAVKGPADKMMRELGQEVSAAAVAERYRGLIDGMVIDERDSGLVGRIEALGIAVETAPTLMHSVEDRRRLAQATLDFAATLAR